MLIVAACCVHAMRENRFEVLARNINSYNTYYRLACVVKILYFYINSYIIIHVVVTETYRSRPLTVNRTNMVIKLQVGI